jgi:hypothetical protein
VQRVASPEHSPWSACTTSALFKARKFVTVGTSVNVIAVAIVSTTDTIITMFPMIAEFQ